MLSTDDDATLTIPTSKNSEEKNYFEVVFVLNQWQKHPILSVDMLLRYYAITGAFLNFRYYFLSWPVLSYYECFSVNSIIIFSRSVTLLRYYECFSLDTILSVDMLLRYYTITGAFLNFKY